MSCGYLFINNCFLCDLTQKENCDFKKNHVDMFAYLFDLLSAASGFQNSCIKVLNKAVVAWWKLTEHALVMCNQGESFVLKPPLGRVLG